MKLRTKKVKEIMDEKQISEMDIRAKTGMVDSSIRYILRDGYCSPEAAEMMAEVLGVTVQEICASETVGGSTYTENVIEFLRDAEEASVSLSQGRYKTRIKRLAEKYPGKCRILAENSDGSLYAKFPVSWVKINPCRNITEKHLNSMRKNFSYNNNTGH